MDRQPIPGAAGRYRVQLKVGNRDAYGQDFLWVDEDAIAERETPAEAVVFERVEWGDMHGFVTALYEEERLLAKGMGVWEVLQELLDQVGELDERIHALERGELDKLNRAIDDLRLQERRLQREQNEAQLVANEVRRQALWDEHEALSGRLDELREQQERWEVEVSLAGGETRRVGVAAIVRAYRPNSMGVGAKVQTYLSKGWEFVAGEPRESNTEGGIFPALFGTVMMVMLMSLAAVPFGVLAALYLREYARQGLLVRLVRIAVNNLAGVPSIVFGMFGLGFFVYGIGGSIDQLFYADALPTPTYGTGGILWASLTLALLTVPVVIVATEESLAAVPREMREGALALGATKFQMIWSVVLPSALPGILTGVILATARGAGEVAPLMITGVVKLAPDLPLDAFAPFFSSRAQVYALGLPHLRRGFPVAQRGGGPPHGVHHGLDAVDHCTAPELDGDCRPQQIAQEIRLRGFLGDAMSQPVASDHANSIVEVENLNMFYGETQALHDIDLSIPEREVTAFIGPSGCGKSTLLRCFNRLNDLIESARIEGEVRVNGRDIYAPDCDVIDLRRRVGMVFQKSNPFPKSIYENVAYGLRIAGEKPPPGARRGRGEEPEGRRAVGRGQGPAQGQRAEPVRRSAAATVHCAHPCRRAGGGADGRAVLGAGPDCHCAGRGDDHRPEI